MADQSNRTRDSVAQFQVTAITEVDVRLCKPGYRARPVKRDSVLKLVNAIDAYGYDKVHQLAVSIPTDSLCLCRMFASP
jgi:hypothetical protein